MRQLLHLALVDAPSRSVAVVPHGTRWMFPVISCEERERAGLVVIRWLRRQGIDGSPAGQWLGRVSADALSTDWLVIVDARVAAGAAGPAAWMALDRLAPESALWDYEAWATARVSNGAGLPAVAGPFGHIGWLAEVGAWLARELAPADEAMTPYRIGAYEVVLGCATRRGNAFFKGLTFDRTAEPAIARALERAAPDAFPRTLALEARPDGAVWWLTACCPGTTLTQRRTRDRIVRVTRACARLQRRLMDSAALHALPTLGLEAAAHWISTLLEDTAPQRIRRAALAAIDRACDRIGSASTPHTWVPLDLDPDNVVLDDEGVRFVDVDCSMAGPAPLAVSVFGRRLARLARRAGSAHTLALVRRTYSSCWPDRAALSATEWSAFDLAASLLELHRGWTRLTRNVARGELVVDESLVRSRIVERFQGTLEPLNP